LSEVITNTRQRFFGKKENNGSKVAGAEEITS